MKLREFAPKWLRRSLRTRLKAKRAAQFRRESIADSLEKTAAAVCDSRLEFCAGQRADEIAPFLHWAAETPLRRIAEIGSARGGNLLLFSIAAESESQLISIDLDDDPAKEAVYRRLIEPSHRLTFIAGDSHDPKTVDRFRESLGGDMLDLLFIDGDHSYEGVKADFDRYSPFVRGGGIIGIHDIVPDAFQRFGRATPSDTGGVFSFWNELKANGLDWREFVSDPDQDGFGIGAIRRQ